ncbi:hypothetical protein ACXZ1M_10950 [Duganella sp. PWIR1]
MMERAGRRVAACTAWVALALAAAGAACAAEPAAAPLVVHYNERPPHHYTQRGAPAGDAVDKVERALTAVGIAHTFRSTPAKQQLVILKANQEPACMMSWNALPGRERGGKLSAPIYEDRRLWCTKAVPDEWMQRLDQALLK